MTNKPLASRLVGKTIGKWHVIKKRDKSEDDNSGFFSTCYDVKDNSGSKAFLKAYNYVYAFKSKAGSADILKYMTENYTYERDLLDFCNENRMRRIVTAIDNGYYSEENEIIDVPYLVFEIAQGNLKSKPIVENPKLAWKLKAFHGALVGLFQLHKAKIVHQDIKPSNILIFGNDYAKISDLGSATQFNNPSNWVADSHVGDQRYAPIELLYGYSSPNWDTRRYGADLFMVGGILAFMLTSMNFLGHMISKMPENKRPFKFGVTFDVVKPILLAAFYETIDEIAGEIPEPIRKDLISILFELSYPIPEDRGNPKRLQRHHRQYSLERYISVIDRLVKTILYAKL